MAWNTVRKEDKPYTFDKVGLTLVEYSNDGRLYFVDNLNNIIVGEDDYLAVSYIPVSETDNRLPVVCVRGLGSISKDFLNVCKWLDFNPNNFHELPRYHEENIIKNISREDGGESGGAGGAGGMIIISVNPANGEQVDSNSTFNRPQPQNQNNQNDDNNSNQNDKPSENGGVNTSEQSNYDEFDDFFEELEKESEVKPDETVRMEDKIGSIFSFVRKVH